MDWLRRQHSVSTAASYGQLPTGVLLFCAKVLSPRANFGLKYPDRYQLEHFFFTKRAWCATSPSHGGELRRALRFRLLGGVVLAKKHVGYV